MSFDHPVSFEDALANAAVCNKDLFLLLGNGFSMEWDRDTFGHDNLLDGVAGISSELKKLFKQYDTSNFEAIMQALERARKIAPIYGFPKKFRTRMEESSV